MIITLEKARQYSEFDSMSDSELTEMINALEIGIRKETNNNFQNRNVRFLTSSDGRYLNDTSPYISAGDTIQISQSGVNDGIYEVTAVSSQYNITTINKDIYTIEYNLVTKVEYPADVQLGVINLMRYIKRMEKASNELTDRIGIASETISRHTVSYDTSHMTNWITGDLSGFPSGMLTFLKRYRKARF